MEWVGELGNLLHLPRSSHDLEKIAAAPRAVAPELGPEDEYRNLFTQYAE
jgi:hypothetical protein